MKCQDGLGENSKVVCGYSDPYGIVRVFKENLKLKDTGWLSGSVG